MNEPQILVKLQGGLGNIMFQIASMESLKTKYNYSIAYTNYNEQAQEYVNIGRLLFPTYIEKIFSKINNKFNYKTFIPRIKVEETEYFNDLLFLEKDKEYLFIGYLQNHNFFIERHKIIDMFDLSKILIPEKYINLLQCGNSVSLHVRRGDYLNIQPILVCQSKEYYDRSITYFGDYNNVFIFSDDIEWCKQNFNFKNMVFVEEDELVSLKMMSLCDKHIIGNSTFSWWGAYLSNSIDVIMPQRWFGQAVSNPRPLDHYMVPGWTIL